MTWIFVVPLSFLLYVFFLAYVTLWEAKRNGKLAMAPLPVRAMAWTILVIAVVLDVWFNIVVGSVIFLELPEVNRLLFTARCAKWRHAMSWRGRLARWFCDGWMNPFDAGHC